MYEVLRFLASHNIYGFIKNYNFYINNNNIIVTGFVPRRSFMTS